jgi:hypothetical protein
MKKFLLILSLVFCLKINQTNGLTFSIFSNPQNSVTQHIWEATKGLISQNKSTIILGSIMICGFYLLIKHLDKHFKPKQVNNSDNTNKPEKKPIPATPVKKAVEQPVIDSPIQQNVPAAAPEPVQRFATPPPAQENTNNPMASPSAWEYVQKGGTKAINQTVTSVSNFIDWLAKPMEEE